MKSLAPLVAFVAWGCGSPSTAEPHEGRVASAIVDGQTDMDDDTVVALERNGTVACSGTLIAPNLVLTAAHCVVPSPPDAIVYGAGDLRFAVQTAHVHPGFDLTTLAEDIAILVLEHDVDDATVATLPTTNKIARGDHIDLIGYGGDAPDEPIAERHRRAGFVVVDSVSADSVTVVPDPSQPCGGDSGGAGFTYIAGTWTLVAVISGGDIVCDGSARLMAIDTAFVDSFRNPAPAAAGGCALARQPDARFGIDGAAIALALALLTRRRAAIL